MFIWKFYQKFQEPMNFWVAYMNLRRKTYSIFWESMCQELNLANEPHFFIVGRTISPPFGVCYSRAIPSFPSLGGWLPILLPSFLSAFFLAQFLLSLKHVPRVTSETHLLFPLTSKMKRFKVCFYMAFTLKHNYLNFTQYVLIKLLSSFTKDWY